MGSGHSKRRENRWPTSEKLWRVPNPVCAAEYRARAYHDTVRCPYCVQAEAYASLQKKTLDPIEEERERGHRQEAGHKRVAFNRCGTSFSD